MVSTRVYRAAAALTNRYYSIDLQYNSPNKALHYEIVTTPFSPPGLHRLNEGGQAFPGLEGQLLLQPVAGYPQTVLGDTQ